MRIIPARAGFTMMRAITASSWRDHPRSRGVYMARLGREEKREGSSPLARGLPHRLGVEFIERGIIPARAGFTLPRLLLRRWSRDHLRSRGVYSGFSSKSRSMSGSSPLARGLPRAASLVQVRIGIIPARAGFTGPMRGPQRICRDHPRSRGVYMSSIMKTAGRAGSSPLARGLLGKLVPVLSGERIIPARAGFTVVRFWTWSFRPDHPRSRGVYHRRRELTTAILGSSPLARGLPPGPVSRPYGFGIIPARAGFTLFSGPAYAPHGDHPRSRGVYLAKSSYTMNAVGSSPLARGLLGSRGPVEHVQRIIPARAGFTTGIASTSALARDHPRSRGVYA